MAALGILFYASFLGGGAFVAAKRLEGGNMAVRAWLGAAFGLAALMWLPALWAFALGFGLWAHFASAFTYAVLLMLVYVYGPRIGQISSDNAPSFDADDVIPLLLGCGLPFLVGAFMLVTHTLRPVDGALYTGQSCYGDMSLHLGIAQSLWANGEFPPDYNIFPGVRLGYPFLGDALTASLRVFGVPLRWAFIAPGIICMAFVFFGYYVVAKLLLKERAPASLACLLFFVGGGLGFAYFLDGIRENPENLTRVFTGFYLMPTNAPDYNLRWTNVVVDMLVPQRTLLAGWALLMPCIYLLMRAALHGEKKLFWPLGLLAGALPLVHTHSFLGLGVLSAVLLVRDLLCEKNIGKTLWAYVPYGAVAVALAVPQLLGWTFTQSSNESFLEFNLNWVNETDSYLWFYIKNLGVIGLLIPVGVACAGRDMRRLLAGAAVIWVVCEFINFQPNPYDNNKLMLVSWMVLCAAVAGGLWAMWKRTRGLPGRRYLAAVLLICMNLSGLMTFGRGVYSNEYELFSQGHVQAAQFITENTPGDSVFLTSGNHNSAVSALAGRKLVCGTEIYLYFHGLDTQQRRQDIKTIFNDPENSAELIKRYDVDYIYVSDYEYNDIGVDIEGIKSLYPLVFADETGMVEVYAVSKRATGG